jgi:uncharacterized protein YndB with AHSA1/START domain
MSKGLVAKASTMIEVSREKVWDALVSPAAIKQYMFGAEVVSTWRAGAPIVWKGEWNGKPYEDRGVIRSVEPEVRLEYTHWSPLSGQPDVAESYHTIIIELGDDPAGPAAGTHVTLSQDNNPNEQTRQHSEQNWNVMLAGLKKYLERG